MTVTYVSWMPKHVDPANSYQPLRHISTDPADYTTEGLTRRYGQWMAPPPPVALVPEDNQP